MSSPESFYTPPNNLDELTSLEPETRRHESMHGENDGQQDDTQQYQEPAQNPILEARSAEELFAMAPRVSRSRNVGEQEWPEYLPYHDSDRLRDDGSTLSRTINQSTVDRKRRLTNPAHNSGRVRTVSGGFHTRSQSSQSSLPDGSSSASLHHVGSHNPTLRASSRVSFSGRHHGGLPRMSRQSSILQRPAWNAREIILPKWQPDSEVSKCPICSRQFTFWFRKHHCRKCGRVVCASCSPHRITIPRQFIVHPPESMYRTSTLAASQPVVIDLTDEIAPSTRPDMPASWASSQSTSHPGLGGGEEVRLCNPCVPDPQPSHQANIDIAEFLQQGPRQGELESSLQRPPLSEQPSQHSQQAASDEARELRRQRGRGMIVCTHQTRSHKLLTAGLQFQPDSDQLNTIQTRAEEIPDESLPAYGNFNYTLIPNYNRRDRPPYYHPNNALPFSPPGYNSSETSAPSMPNRGQPRSGLPMTVSQSMPS